VHVVYPAVICFQSIHIVHIAISYLMLVIFAIITYLVTVMNFENRYTKDPTSKMSSKTDLLVLLSKIAYVFFFNFFSQNEYVLFKSIILVVFSCLTFVSYVKSRPYFNQTTQLLVEIFSGVFAWTNLVLLFT
jgi:phosphatidylglycerophosphate synthase